MTVRVSETPQVTLSFDTVTDATNGYGGLSTHIIVAGRIYELVGSGGDLTTSDGKQFSPKSIDEPDSVVTFGGVSLAGFGDTTTPLEITSGETFFNGTKTVPKVPTSGLVNIENGQLIIWPDLDGDGDYDADIWANSNMYLASDARIHLRSNISSTGAKPEEGRVVFGATLTTNYLQSAKDFGGSTLKDFAIGPYNSTNWWMYFDESTTRIGVGTDTPRGHFHIEDGSTGGTVNAGANSFIIEKSGGHAGMTIMTDGDKIGEINFASDTDNNIGSVWYDHAIDTMKFRADDILRVSINSDGLMLNTLPTSATGLATGQIWNDSGTLKVA